MHYRGSCASRRVVLLLVVTVAGFCATSCVSREMSRVEKEHFADKLFDESTKLDMNKVRVVKGGVADINDFMGGVVLWNHIHMSTPLYRKDYRDAYEDLFGHELTHVWQHQNRHWTGYSIWRALREQLRYEDPYYYDEQPILDRTSKEFTKYRFEQQGAIVGDYFWYSSSTWPDYQERASIYREFLKSGMVPPDTALTMARTDDEASNDLQALHAELDEAILTWERFPERSTDTFQQKYGPEDDVRVRNVDETARWVAERARRAHRIRELLPRLQSEMRTK